MRASTARWTTVALLLALTGCDGDDGATPADGGGAGGEAGMGGTGGGMGGTGGGMGGMGGGMGGMGGGLDMAPPADMSPEEDAAPDPEPDPDMAVDMAPVDSPIDCEAVCTGLQTQCPEAFAIHGDCDNCAELSGAFAGGGTDPLLTAADVCIEATETDDCRGLYTCLIDPDGLLAVGTGASLSIVGTVGGVEYDLAVDDAWAAVGIKNDGSPSDLELSFVTDDGRFLAVKFDDLAFDVGPLGFGLLDASNNEVQVQIPGDRIDLDTGLVEVVRFELPGGEDPGFQITAEVRENREATPVTVTARGTFQ